MQSLFVYDDEHTSSGASAHTERGAGVNRLSPLLLFLTYESDVVLSTVWLGLVLQVGGGCGEEAVIHLST